MAPRKSSRKTRSYFFRKGSKNSLFLSSVATYSVAPSVRCALLSS